MESIDKILKAVLDAHAGDPQLLALQLKASPASVQRWLAGEAKPRPAYEAKLRQFFSELAHKPQALHETAPPYREIAARLGMSEAAVKVAAHRVRARLKGLIREEVLQTVASAVGAVRARSARSSSAARIVHDYPADLRPSPARFSRPIPAVIPQMGH